MTNNQFPEKYSKNNLLRKNIAKNHHLIKLNKKKPTIYSYYGKRLVDIFLSIIGIVFALPIIIVIIIAIKLDTSGKAFYRQERVGQWGKTFQILKLRSMHKNADQIGPHYTEKNDSRITRVGFFIRARRLDELPQLINVLAGNMSMVGPRPFTLLDTQLNTEVSGFCNRLIVKPGLTGWAQVNGGNNLSIEEKLQYDLFYIQHIGFLFDIKIILKTIIVIFSGEGAR
ncbi:Sugar transferase involved in LPS biosynthesis (colanic, teichoic acid) [Seinonella peptonophila]|uniref:Sugar transferase involved in LPS biosynthesis (Colanic, teichoic acid) n=1 Tax=Seinonella peptonophila TaxID=112248 RepID=A0A1M5AEP5_9BACL|nr:sugar transferase [Seinonella peptonophila]SHF28372.1 Sugar transferase involved in LPS biosynthesis (colanic, teichoic acid) [Seinonella peptonophila]